MCANHPIEPGDMLAPIPTAVPPETEETFNTETQRRGDAESPALKAMGYRVLEDDATAFAMTLETPFEGADIHAILAPCERNHYGLVAVKNTRGVGWCMKVEFVDMGRSVAKKPLRSLALETRRAYNHRGQKIRKRAIRRAIERKEGGRHD